MSDVTKLSPYSDGKRRKMSMTKLTAVALTGRGANPEANVTFFKSHKSETKIKKGGDLADLLTSEEAGHQHGISVETYANELYINVMYAKSEGADSGHYHVLTRVDGAFVVSTNEGHNHTVDSSLISDALLSQLSKGEAKDTITKQQAELLTAVSFDGITTKSENDMSDALKKKLEDAQAKLDKQAVTIANQAVVASFTPTTKAFHDGLSAEDQVSFIGKTDADRVATMEMAKSSNPVVYTSTDGTEFHKSDSAVMVKMAKQIDVQAVQLAKGEALNKHSALVKRAGVELGNVTGEDTTKIALLGAIDTIEDEETRKGALAIMKAANTSGALSLETLGTQKVEDVAKAEDKLDKMVTDFAKDKKVNVAEAYTKVLATAEGQDLYNEINAI